MRSREVSKRARIPFTDSICSLGAARATDVSPNERVHMASATHPASVQPSRVNARGCRLERVDDVVQGLGRRRARRVSSSTSLHR